MSAGSVVAKMDDRHAAVTPGADVAEYTAPLKRIDEGERRRRVPLLPARLDGSSRAALQRR
ncbi:hypothetical protein WL98_19915 [Burkholderia multivorans]|nr:hypothetical protein WL98_19915 [Burkholderia multivorans]